MYIVSSYITEFFFVSSFCKLYEENKSILRYCGRFSNKFNQSKHDILRLGKF